MKILKRTVIVLCILAITLTAFAGCAKKAAEPEENKQAPIVVMGPMDVEFDIISKLDEATEYVHANASVVEGTLNGYPVVAIKPLVGMVNASAATTYAIEKYAPRCVIMQGTSGGHDPELRQGDIVLGENIIEIMSCFSPHRDEGEGSKVEDWTYPGAEMLVDGEAVRTSTLHSDEALLKIAEKVEYKNGKLVRGVIGSGDVWNKEIDRINYLHKNLGTSCEEMEGFSVAQVCTANSVPCLVIRVISNSELYPDEAFDPKMATFCQEYTVDVIKAIINS